MTRVVALAALICSGCSTGLLQTGKTQKPTTVSALVGASHILNDRFAAAGLPEPYRADPRWFPEAALRIGISERVDVGAASYLGMGARLDAKYAFLPREERFAIAARAGGGVAASNARAAGVAMVGAVASYDVTSFFVPYAGVTFTNHWIGDPTQRRPLLPPGERYASRTNTGDGVLQLAAGVSLHPNGGPVGLMAEVGRWIPAQNDPGDAFRFVPTTFLVGAARFCTDCP